MTRPIPNIAVDFVAKWEGLELTAYRDIVGVLTIGYGHTGPDVKPGQKVTKAEAKALLRSDMQIAVRKLYSVVKPDVIESLSDGQYAALLSFCYNLGAKKTWTIWKRLNARQFDRVPVEMQKFSMAGGKVVKGLQRRRADEVALWAKHEADDAPAPPSVVTRQPGMTPPVPMEKPVSTSKTFWAGAGTAASGVAAGAAQVQAIAAPQADHSDLIRNVLAGVAVLVVACGIAVMVFKWLDTKAARS